MNAPTDIATLKITIKDTQPPIWRTVEVPLNLTLDGLHEVIQVLFGWTQIHLYHFEIHGETYGNPLHVTEFDHVNLANFALEDVLEEPGQTFTYIYDYGDYWVHQIELQFIGEPEEGREYPYCAHDERASPLENSGGAHHHNELVEAIGDSTHPQHKKWTEWTGGDYEPETFDRKLHNQVLRDMKGSFGRGNRTEWNSDGTNVSDDETMEP